MENKIHQNPGCGISVVKRKRRSELNLSAVEIAGQALMRIKNAEPAAWNKRINIAAGEPQVCVG
jgi:hypothetical protein